MTMIDRLIELLQYAQCWLEVHGMMLLYWHKETRDFYVANAIHGWQNLSYSNFMATKPSFWALIDWYAGILRALVLLVLAIIINLKAWSLWP
jgi:hypothetical protein